MEVFDLILEAVENSVEAGASAVEATVEIMDGRCRVSVVDDGDAWIPDNPFEKGCSTKGRARGLGLAEIAEVSGGNCSLVRDGGVTRLEFCATGLEDSGRLSDSLLPIFLFPADISLTVNMSGKSFALSTGELRAHDAFPDRAGAIGRFKEMARLKEGEIYG